MDKNITEFYPEERPKLPERVHASFTLEIDKCIACGLCKNACPNAVIKLGTRRNENKKRELTSYEMELQYCLFCGLCVESCPTNAIYFNDDFELSCYSRGGTVLKLMEQADADEGGADSNPQ
ncbi:4Fe-4S binding protein [Desulfitispora alkaliphila]|uniref:4Fe-4S binding protein n=1 Tax=Desulfitispora alkaliphila TaxID=622674 RepID=UPI003D260427